jgi:transmembrane sensor
MENESKYKDFLARDFLCDEYFQDWVMHPDPKKNQFWQQWLLQNPEKEAVVSLAKETLLNLDFKINRPSPEKGKESLEKTWAIIDGLETSKPPSKESKVIPINAQEQIENENLEEEQASRLKPVVFRMLTSLAIAASVLLVIGLGWKLFSNNKVESTVVQNTKEKTDSILFIVRHEVNTTDKEKKVQLPDGSVIILADKGEITYREPFTNRRDITLIGKAYFRVAKDQTKPFTVISGDISTTALGTEFTVTTLKDQNRIIVRLYEGKVVVKPIDKANKKFKNDVYLLPGQEFVYDNQLSGKKRAFKLNDAAAPEKILSEELHRDNPLLPENAEGSWYMFNNETLGQVFDQLAGLYNVQIIYDQKDVQDIYLTGKYDRSDSLEYILDQIGTLHNLKITKKDSAFIITK